ncbi:MAG: hypothetical protein DMF16_08335 [Verrucomicrobia bacterium]|nr:MAG: hypothetical protein DMF16_08335 [Verrucomicrobiota bacterium]
MLLAYLFSTPVELMPNYDQTNLRLFSRTKFRLFGRILRKHRRDGTTKSDCYMSDKAARLLDGDVLRKFFTDLNATSRDRNFDRKALSARREDPQNVMPTVEVRVD